MTKEHDGNPEGVDDDGDAGFDGNTFEDVFVLGDPPPMPDDLWESTMAAAFDWATPDESLFPPGSVDEADVEIAAPEADEPNGTGDDHAVTPADAIRHDSADEGEEDASG